MKIPCKNNEKYPGRYKNIVGKLKKRLTTPRKDNKHTYATHLGDYDCIMRQQNISISILHHFKQLYSLKVKWLSIHRIAAGEKNQRCFKSTLFFVSLRQLTIVWDIYICDTT